MAASKKNSSKNKRKKSPANKKKTTTKKVTTKKKSSTPKKKTTSKKVTTTKGVSAKKTSSKNTTVKKKTSLEEGIKPKKSTTVKKSTSPKKVSKPKVVKEPKKKVITVEDLKVSKEISLPKLKQDVKKSSKSNAKKIATRKKKSNNFTKEFNKLIRKIRIYGIQSVIPLKNIIVIMIVAFALLLGSFILNMFINKVSYIDLDLVPSKIDQLQTLSFNLDIL